jgi:predicted nucleic acid-binding protein
MKSQLREMIIEEISNTKSITENKVVKLTHDHVLAAQKAAAKSKLSYEEGWDILAAYFIATMGESNGTNFILSLEKQHKSIYK